ncbi:MAG: glycosyltransferase family 39 protein [Promethearchaeota archaeon]
MKINDYNNKLEWIILCGLLTSSFLLRVFLSYQIVDVHHGDPAFYYVLAENLVSGKGFTIEYLWHFHVEYSDIAHPIDYWAPGISIITAVFFSFFGESWRVATLVVNFSGTFIVLMVYCWGKYLFNKKIGFVAAFFSSINPYFLTDSTYLGPDTTYIFTLILASFLIIKGINDDNKKFWAIGGCLVGISYLMRYEAATIMITVFIYFIIRRKKLTFKENNFWLCILFFLFIVSPWLIRNSIIFHDPFFSTQRMTGTLFEWEDFYRLSLPPWESHLSYVGLRMRLIALRLSLEPLLGQLSTLGFLFFGIGVYLSSSKKEIWFFYIRAILGLLSTSLLFPVSTLQGHPFPTSYIDCLPVFIILMVVGLFKFSNKFRNMPFPANRPYLLKIFVFIGLLILVTAQTIIIFRGGDFYGRVRSSKSTKEAYGSLGEWIQENTPKDSIIMTRNPWELYYYSRRRAIMIPNEDFQTILEIVKKYYVDYLEIDASFYKLREPLIPLYNMENIPDGFTLVYKSDTPYRVLLYKINISDV